jgi:hypothetical protein
VILVERAATPRGAFRLPTPAKAQVAVFLPPAAPTQAIDDPPFVLTLSVAKNLKPAKSAGGKVINEWTY